MKLTTTAFGGAVLASLMSIGVAAERAPTDAEIRKNQHLGRVIVSPEGKLFLYEWARPYNWTPETEWLHPTAAKRMQTWLYKVDLTYGDENVTSRYIFHPGSGATYYLGSLSPDAKMISFYELDHDDNTIKAGVWNFAHEQLTFFDATPNSSRLEEGPIWLANDKIAYSSSSGWVGGNVPVEKKAVGRIVPPDWDDTVKTTACADCEAQKNQRIVASVSGGEGKGTTAVGPDASLLARSPNGDLSVFMRDTSDVLALMYQRGADSPVTVFENERLLEPRSANRSDQE